MKKNYRRREGFFRGFQGFLVSAEAAVQVWRSLLHPILHPLRDRTGGEQHSLGIFLQGDSRYGCRGGIISLNHDSNRTVPARRCSR